MQHNVMSRKEYLQEKIMVSNVHLDSSGKYWAFDRIRQAAITIDEDFSRIHYIRGTRVDGIRQPWSPVESYCERDVIWINSCDRSDILVYDIQNGRFREVLNPLAQNHSVHVLYDMIKYGDWILLLARSFSADSFIFDTRSESYRRVHFFEETSEEFQERYTFFYIHSGTLYLVVAETNKIIKINLETIGGKVDFDVWTLDADIKGVCMCRDDDRLYLSSKGNGNIIVFDSAGNRSEIQGFLEKDLEREAYCKIFCEDNFIIALPRFDNKVLIHDRTLHESHVLSLPHTERIVYYENMPSLCNPYLYVKKQRMLFLLPWGYDKISRIDLDTFEIESFEPYMDYESHVRIISERVADMRRHGLSRYTFIENTDVGLEEYLIMLSEGIIR